MSVQEIMLIVLAVCAVSITVFLCAVIYLVVKFLRRAYAVLDFAEKKIGRLADSVGGVLGFIKNFRSKKEDDE